MLSTQLLFFFSLFFLFFLPGYFLLVALFGIRQKKHFLRTPLWRIAALAPMETFTASAAISIPLITFFGIALDTLQIPLTGTSFSATVLGFSLLCTVCFIIRTRHLPPQEQKNNPLFSFSRTQTVAVLLIIFLTIFIKTVYLSTTILPTATDLGHHMYWVQRITAQHTLPTYEKQEILSLADDGYALSAPQAIADFIIGEHVPLGALSLLSGTPIVSAFPSITLLAINILSLLALFLVGLRLFGALLTDPHRARTIAIVALFLIGPLYAISSAQAKFVSGGVIGNIIGNFLLPVIFLFSFRALTEKSAGAFFIALFLFFGLLYTHHLSAFVFLYCIGFIVIVLLLSAPRTIPALLTRLWSVFKNPLILLLLTGMAAFLFVIYTPSYIATNAVQTAIGTPTKTTRTGLTFAQLSATAGDARMALGLCGLLLLSVFTPVGRTLYARIRKYLLPLRPSHNPASSSFDHILSLAILIGWTLAIILMTLRPHWLLLDIPSNRIANYIGYPVTLLAAFFFVWLFFSFRNNSSARPWDSLSQLGVGFLILLFAFVVANGTADNGQSLAAMPKTKEATQTYAVSTYLAATLSSEDRIVKDHNYIVADAWMKVFLLKGYSDPLSRGFFKRYEDVLTRREQCTLHMITTPHAPVAQRCFNDLGVTTVVVNANFDSEQFNHAKQFARIYASDTINVFLRDPNNYE